ncbi:hypothetical protein ACOME3_008740 [Neoechinorhynchus agilis]
MANYFPGYTKRSKLMNDRNSKDNLPRVSSLGMPPPIKMSSSTIHSQEYNNYLYQTSAKITLPTIESVCCGGGGGGGENNLALITHKNNNNNQPGNVILSSSCLVANMRRENRNLGRGISCGYSNNDSSGCSSSASAASVGGGVGSDLTLMRSSYEPCGQTSFAGISLQSSTSFDSRRDDQYEQSNVNQIPTTLTIVYRNDSDSTCSSEGKDYSSNRPLGKRMERTTQSPKPVITEKQAKGRIERELDLIGLKPLRTNFAKYYRKGSFIRAGGFSDIFHGRRYSNNEEVILKFIPKYRTRNWLSINGVSYPTELALHKIASTVKGVIGFHDYFQEPMSWVIVIEHLPKCLDLFDYMERVHRGRLCEDTARYFFKQLVRINHRLIRMGIVHRDIKSENVLVNLENNKLVLIDFGASAILKSCAYVDFHGTRQFKPPEYVKTGRYYAESSTVWALGVLLYDMVVGKLPYENEVEIINNELDLKCPLSAGLRDLLKSCLNSKPERRPTLRGILSSSWLQCITETNHQINNAAADISLSINDNATTSSVVFNSNRKNGNVAVYNQGQVAGIYHIPDLAIGQIANGFNHHHQQQQQQQTRQTHVQDEDKSFRHQVEP